MSLRERQGVASRTKSLCSLVDHPRQGVAVPFPSYQHSKLHTITTLPGRTLSVIGRFVGSVSALREGSLRYEAAALRDPPSRVQIAPSSSASCRERACGVPRKDGRCRLLVSEIWPRRRLRPRAWPWQHHSGVVASLMSEFRSAAMCQVRSTEGISLQQNRSSLQ